MPTYVNNEKELNKAIHSNEDTIYIEGDLGNKVMKIKATGNVAWVIAFGAIAVTVIAILSVPTTGGTSAPAAGISGLTAAPIAVATLGARTVTSIISMCIATGSLATAKLFFKNLRRNYDIVKQGDMVVLKRRNK